MGFKEVLENAAKKAGKPMPKGKGKPMPKGKGKPMPKKGGKPSAKPIDSVKGKAASKGKKGC